MENIRTIFIYVMVVLCAICTGCVTTATDGIESLVESRIILERDRIRGEYAAELAGWVNQDLREIGERLNNIADGQALLRAAIEEYRRFTLELIERLQRAESGDSKERYENTETD